MLSSSDALWTIGGDERGLIVVREARHPLSVLFTLQQLSSTSSSYWTSFWDFNIPGLRFGISGMPFDRLTVQCTHTNSNAHVYSKSALTNQKTFASCLVLRVLLPRQWPQNWNGSLGAALWLSTAPEHLGWVKCSRPISP